MSKVHVYYRTATPVLGAVTFNTVNFHGELVSVHVKPTTPTTTYKVLILDKKGLILWASALVFSGETGEISKTIDNRFVNEILTVEISSASVDEIFEFALRVKGYTLTR